MSSKPILSEKELLKQVSNGSESAFIELYRAYKDKLFSFIIGISKDEKLSEDILQDVFLKIWRDRASIGTIDNFNAYLFRISQNHLIDQLRRFSRETKIIDSLTGVFSENMDNDSALDTLERKEIQEKIQDAILKLPPQQQKIYVMHKENGLKTEEIAKELNLSVSTIRNHIMHATSNIKQTLLSTYPQLPFLIISTLFKLF